MVPHAKLFEEMTMAGDEPWIEGTQQGDTVPSGKSMREALERRRALEQSAQDFSK
jgi:hypothetical protein